MGNGRSERDGIEPRAVGGNHDESFGSDRSRDIGPTLDTNALEVAQIRDREDAHPSDDWLAAIEPISQPIHAEHERRDEDDEHAQQHECSGCGADFGRGHPARVEGGQKCRARKSSERSIHLPHNRRAFGTCQPAR